MIACVMAHILSELPVLQVEFFSLAWLHFSHRNGLFVSHSLPYAELPPDMRFIFGKVFQVRRNVVWPLLLLLRAGDKRPCRYEDEEVAREIR
jgi:hypothetical protein